MFKSLSEIPRSMGLYGLDIVADKRLMLLEINGVRSSMVDFRNIYGDDRVEQRVYRMLEDAHGPMSVYNPAAKRLMLRKRYPLIGRYLARRLTPEYARRKLLKDSLLNSPKAYSSWLQETSRWEHDLEFPFPLYSGQESTVINAFNEELPHPLLNPYVAEAVASNKLMQYLLLRETPLRHHLPTTAAVGLGWADPLELKKLRSEASSFIIKPIAGYLGKGARRCGPEFLTRYEEQAGPVGGGWLSGGCYLEDIVCKDRLCDLGLAIVQPFVGQRRAMNGKRVFSSIRAIVCEGKFIDAYEALSHAPVVNAASESWELPCKTDGIAEFSEKAVATFEAACAAYTPKEFRKRIYSQYFRKHDLARGAASRESLEDALAHSVHLLRIMVDTCDPLC
jgi:hypothetical protein